VVVFQILIVMIFSELQVNQSISLRLLKQEDAQIIFQAIDENRPHLRKWLPFVDQTRSVKDTLSFTKSIVDDVERRQEVFTIWYKDEFAGLIGMKEIDYLNRKVELGYWLIEKMTHQGIVTLSVEKMMDFIFQKLQLNRIQIKCGVGNLSSSAIPKRLGYSLEGIERQGERHLSRYIDLEIYSILREDWH
jgi:ribosomal-protein-serine acetyltransferase